MGDAGSSSSSHGSGGSGGSGASGHKPQIFDSIRKKFNNAMGTLGRKSENPVEAASHKEMVDLTLSELIVKKTLGTGSFGRVLLVQHKVSKKHYAMKVLKKAQVVKLKQVEHTINERRILKIIDNSFTVNLISSFQDDSNLFMVMDYVPGGELFSYLRKQQKFDMETAKFYAAEIVIAFELMHIKDIIYRDLKPENVLLDSEGHIRLTDFGFGKEVPDVTWTLCGTPDYLAPEIIQSKGYGKAVDWYSLGVIIYEMLAGYPPYADDDHFRLYEKILAGKLRFPSKFDPDAKDLCKKLMTADLTRRYGNLKNGSKDIRNHKWFANIDWKKAAKKQLTPPFKPTVKDEGDASNFDDYEEDLEPLGLTGGSDPYRSLFADF